MPDTTADTSSVVCAAIYPPIGICRVGNSPEELYIGPEVPDPPPQAPGFYRDAEGRLKREAARFRVYGLDDAGSVVCELTAEIADIEWTVELENQKAAWYEFQLALDIPEAKLAKPTMLRNLDVDDRAALTIKPGARTIAGVDQGGVLFDGGEFMGTEVGLGELRTDAAGRLLVLGGHGVSASYDGKPATTFANNEGWHDDVSDGPVTATVTVDGRALDVAPAWVVCAPPNYGPQQKSVRTMWDLMRSIAVDAGMLERPARPSFETDLRPIFERLTNLQWVNQGFYAGFGYDGPFELSTPEWLERLNDASAGAAELRRVIANNFRRFEIDGKSPVPWAWLYGDSMTTSPQKTARQHARLSLLQLAFLDQWAAGDFEADYDPDAEPPRSIEEVPLADQPDALTRAAMDFCLADAFHPGCEMTWPLRHPAMYSEAFRLAHRKGPEPSYGDELTIEEALAPGGPVNGPQVPGSISRWMAVPWQTDTASCRSGYEAKYDPYLPTFWPARVPNQVLSTRAYEAVMDESLPLEERRDAFRTRADWDEPLGLHLPYQHQINHMIHHFDQMGVVEVRDGLPDDPDFPAVMQVSDQQPLADDGDRLFAAAERTRTDLDDIDKVDRFRDGVSALDILAADIDNASVDE